MFQLILDLKKYIFNKLLKNFTILPKKNLLKIN